MISVHEACQLIWSEAYRLYPSETDKLEQKNISSTYGKSLAQDIIADRDMPPFNRAAMDGILVLCTEDQLTLNAGQSWKIIGIQKAGAKIDTLPGQYNQALEIMTGAVCPDDNQNWTIIPFEQLAIKGATATLTNSIDIQPQQNIHLKGSNGKKSEVIITKGKKIRGIEIATLASCGYHQVNVLHQLKIAILTTGDELVPVNAEPMPWQIRMSNAPAMEAILTTKNVAVDYSHVTDDQIEIEKAIANRLEASRILLVSGGVSKGRCDYVPEILQKLGAVEIFHGVAQRPGKPLWFGCYRQCLIFGLPGNPVSALTCLHRYVLPLLSIEGYNSQNNPLLQHEILLPLSEDVNLHRPLTFFLPVQKKVDDSSYGSRLIPRPTNSSGDTRGLISTDGFAELTANTSIFHKGTLVPYYHWG